MLVDEFVIDFLRISAIIAIVTACAILLLILTVVCWIRNRPDGVYKTNENILAYCSPSRSEEPLVINSLNKEYFCWLKCRELEKCLLLYECREWAKDFFLHEYTEICFEILPHSLFANNAWRHLRRCTVYHGLNMNKKIRSAFCCIPISSATFSH